MRLTQSKLSKKDRSFLKRAMKAASLSTCKKRHGAVVVKSGSVMGVGVNSQTNDLHIYDYIPRDSWSVHAEVAALRACKTDLQGATIYVARVGVAGRQMMSKPCSRCQEELRKRGIKRVVYTVESELDLTEGSR